MAYYNLKSVNNSIEDSYQHGLLPQRNQIGKYYQDTSCRSNLSNFSLSSENRRIINKTQDYHFDLIPLSELKYTPQLQKNLSAWIKILGWDFPTSSIKYVFKHHIFNHLYIWYNQQNEPIAYSVCFFSQNFSHIAYVFYNPSFTHNNLPIRLVIQFIIDSHQKGCKYAYLGRFSKSGGYYKRNMPGFEYFSNNQWLKYQS